MQFRVHLYRKTIFQTILNIFIKTKELLKSKLVKENSLFINGY